MSHPSRTNTCQRNAMQWTVIPPPVLLRKFWCSWSILLPTHRTKTIKRPPPVCVLWTGTKQSDDMGAVYQRPVQSMGRRGKYCAGEKGPVMWAFKFKFDKWQRMLTLFLFHMELLFEILVWLRRCSNSQSSITEVLLDSVRIVRLVTHWILSKHGNVFVSHFLSLPSGMIPSEPYTIICIACQTANANRP